MNLIEFELLKEYMDIYIQLLPYCEECGGMRIDKSVLPTFEYFKKNYTNEAYSLVIPSFKDVRDIDREGDIVEIYLKGVGVQNGLA